MRRRRPPGGRFGDGTHAGTELRKAAPPPIDRERRAIRSARAALRKRLAPFLAEQARALAEQITVAIAAEKAAGARLRKADDEEEIDEDLVRRILRTLNFEAWGELVPDVEAILQRVHANGAAAAARQLGVPPADATEQVKIAAAEWAQERAAGLIGKRRQADGTLVDNPNPRWAITESTRESLRDDVIDALEEGWSTDTLAEELEDSYAFSPERAQTIARTEVAKADVAGNLTFYQDSGLVSGKRWLVGSEGSCPVCEGAAAKGVVPLDDDFGGVGDPPGHPNCVCDIVPVLAEEEATAPQD